MREGHVVGGQRHPRSACAATPPGMAEDNDHNSIPAVEEESEETKRLHVSANTAVRIVELMRERSTPLEWAGWLSRPLEHAATVGDQDLTEDLMLAGASGNPVMAAVRGRQPKLLEHLLSNGEDANQVDTGEESSVVQGSLLDRAARLGYDDVVETLLDAGADPDRRNGIGIPPLGVASAEGHVGVISVIAARRPDTLSQRGEAPDEYAALHHAAARNQAGSIEALARAGASLEIEDGRGLTALHVAAAGDCSSAVDALLRLGADKESLDPNTTTPLLLAIRDGNEAAARVLMEAGADCLGGGRDAADVLELAVRGESMTILRALVHRGLDACPSTDQESAPLHDAAWQNLPLAIDILVEAGANVEAKCLAEGSRPMHIASQNAGNVAAIEALARHGADVNAKKTSSGDTPLHIAARNYPFELSPASVDALLKAGADETIVNAAGQSPAEALDISVANTGIEGYDGEIRALLENAPQDRADRAWARRSFVVMCRAFSGRVRLIPESTPDDNRRRVAPEEDTGGANGSTGFVKAMGSLLGLETELFRLVVEFL